RRHTRFSRVEFRRVLFRSQKAALMAAYQRKENIVFYYWYPTPLVGAMDLVKLELPEYEAATHACLTDVNCADPKPSDYPENPVRSEERRVGKERHYVCSRV